MNIRIANPEDFDAIWPFFYEIVSAGETYSFPRDLDYVQGYSLWMEVPRQTFVCEQDGKILATYFIKSNQQGPGSHVCNCGYMVSPVARGLGIATLMCEHSQMIAGQLGYKAMQFNSVVSTNTGAVRLWQHLGYEIVGRLPKAFQHPHLGFVDALVMYKWLSD